MESEAEDKVDAVDAIEDFVDQFLSQLLRNGQDDDDGHKRPRMTMKLVDRTRTLTNATLTRDVVFPRSKITGMASCLPFAQLFAICDAMHQALIEDVPVTKRDIYYRDVPLFKTQRTVDTLVDDLAATMELERADLHVRATAKGLVCGSRLSIELKTGEMLLLSDTEPTLVPVAEDVETYRVEQDLAWVLLVEKDAIFQTLRQLNITDHPSLPGPGLIITGKGYPDVATRQLVKTLSDCLSPCIPILALVDCDAFGIDIMSIYKYGSQALKHENDKLAAARVKWLGLLSTELNEFGVDLQSRMPITRHDEQKALSMLRKPLPKKWRKEICHLLFTRRKAEIEVLCSSLTLSKPARDIGSAGAGSRPSRNVVKESPAEIPLLMYLVRKVNDAVSTARARFVDGR